VIITLHLMASIVLIVFILLHAGARWSVRTCSAGAAVGRWPGRRSVEKNLDRLTVVVALVFTFTSVVLSDASRLTCLVD